MDQKQQETLFKLSMYEQQIRQLQQQFQAVEESIIDLRLLDLGLDELKNSTGKEILAPFGKGIFVKAKIISEDLIVDVGNRNLVKKNIQKTKDIIIEQNEKLNEIQKELEEKIEEVSNSLTQALNEAQRIEQE